MNLRKVLLPLVWLFVLCSAFGLAGYFYLYQVYLPAVWQEPVELAETVGFEIQSGESVASVAARLEEAGLIADDWIFVEYLKQHDLDQKIQAGHFLFTGSYTTPELAERLLTGGSTQVRFTVLEGWNSTEIDAMLGELGMIPDFGEFASFVRDPSTGSGQALTDLEWIKNRPVESLEGYLFPDTYFLDSESYSSESLISRMLAAMESNLAKAGWDPANSQRSLHEVLTMASIIQLEERDPAQQKLVADVLWRRLDAGIALGADATLFYELGHKEFLTAEDLALDSPYNTRKNRGLPPTPIGAPGLFALTAALNPEPNDYWFYLHDTETGEIYFAKDLEEHNRNKAQYIR